MAETFKIVTESGVEIELKKWITIGESKQIEAIMYEGVEIKSIQKLQEQEFERIDAGIIEKMERKTFEIIIVSPSIEEVYNLPSTDYAKVKEAVDSVASGEELKKK